MPVCRRCPAAGFTLLELMVVLVLIGIIFTFAVLSFGGDDLAEAMEREAHRLATLVSLANDEAVLRGEELAMRFTEHGYEFMLLTAAGWQSREGDSLLKPHALPPGLVPLIPGAPIRQARGQHLASPQVTHRVTLIQEIARAIHHRRYDVHGQRIFVHLKAARQATDAGGYLIITHHLGVGAHHARLHLADAGKLVCTGQHRDNTDGPG